LHAAYSCARSSGFTPLSRERLTEATIIWAVKTIRAEVKQVATGFAFTEGPCWLPDGSLLFSDIPNNVIQRLGPDGQASVWRERSGCDDERSTSRNRGSNGLTLDGEGRVLICEHGNRRVTRVERDGRLTVLTERFEGRRLNSPNDIVVKSDGAIYFTDPPYGLDGREEDPARELTFSGVYRLAPSGELRLLTTVLRRPNGLAFSPDESYLYVGNSEHERKIWMRFPVLADGSLGEGDVFFDATSHDGAGVPDGFRVRTDGTIFSSGPGGIVLISAGGEYAGTIPVPEVTSNCCWGGAAADELYVTATTSVYRIRL
jgi:gluconolactonase